MFLLIDLDNTIYPASSGLLSAIDRRMSRFMVEKMGFPPGGVDEIRVLYWKTYGTTLKGLRETVGVDEYEFLRFVHELEVSDHIFRDDKLKSLLHSLPYRKFIYTNADEGHANRVLETLGVAGEFDGIFDVVSLGMCAKPDPESYERVAQKLQMLDGKTPPTCPAHSANPGKPSIVFFDDCEPYLKPAKDLGWATVHISEDEGQGYAAEGGIESWIDCTIATIHEAPRSLEILGLDEGGAI